METRGRWGALPTIDLFTNNETRCAECFKSMRVNMLENPEGKCKACRG